MYSGKPHPELCETDDIFFFPRKCSINKTCNSQTQGPSEGEGTYLFIYK